MTWGEFLNRNNLNEWFDSLSVEQMLYLFWKDTFKN